MRAAGAADLVDEGQQQRRGDEDEMDARQHDQPVGRRLVHEGAQQMDRGDHDDGEGDLDLDIAAVELAQPFRLVGDAGGIDPLQKRYVMLKSRVHWRAGLGAMVKAVVDCAGIGVCTSDYSELTFRKVRRPIYPLDLPNR